MISLWLGAWANHAGEIVKISLALICLYLIWLLLKDFRAREIAVNNLDAESARMDLIVAVRPLRHNRPKRKEGG